MKRIADPLQEILRRIEQNRLRAAEQGGSISQQEQAYECPKCKDKEGFIRRNEDGYEVWVYCECHEKKMVQRLFKSSRITEEFRKLGFKNFVTEGRPQPVIDAYNCAVTYFRNFEKIKNERRNSIALLGQPGAGKTHLLTAICNCLMSKGIGVLYFPWVEGFNELRDDLEMLDTKIHRMQTVPVLFLDDLFKGRKQVTDFQIEQLFAVINYRYLNHLPVLISSEKDIDQICEIDEAIGSRIYEMCKDYTVILRSDGESLNYRLGA